MAEELIARDRAEARERSQRAFAARGDQINAEIQATWRDLPIAEVRRRHRETPAALRDALSLVPPDRWTADEENLRFIHIYTIEHYQDHAADLEAILTTFR